ncbi:hypothetical protein [Comamonas thiooxydans]|uniref:hypothetical protein n=1 Tax=Comamonas thiooxydans TaxID=363952 RepID=UPI00103DE25B|nr:hypothetical protein [Comamonas thiooxydans]
MRFSFRLLLLLMAFWSHHALALVPTVSQFTIEFYGFTGPDPAAICQQAIAQGYGSASRYDGGSSGGYCRLTDSAGNPYANLNVYPISSSCPANSSPSGSSCACNSGFQEKNGQCVKPDACSGLAAYCSGLKGVTGMFESKGQVDMSSGSCQKALDYPGCSQGCATSAVGMSVQYKNGAGQWMSAQEMKVTGGTCNVPPDTDQPSQKDTDCAGGYAEMNGVKKCVPAEAAKGDTKEKTTEKADGSKETVKTETKCENGVCETTKTTTKTGADGSTSTETSKTAQDQNSYCSKNPTSTVCAAANGGKNPGSGGAGSGSGSGSGTGSGNGNGSGNCTGDKCEGNGDGSGNGSTTVEVPDIEVKKLYERKYPKGIASAWSQSGIQKASEKFSSLASVFAPPWYDQKGQCQRFTLSMNVGIFNWGQFDVSPDCSLWIFLWVCMQIGAILLFRALVFGG